MSFLIIGGYLLICIGLTIPALVLVVNPLILWIASRHKPNREYAQFSEYQPTVSMVIAVHNGEKLIRKKINNALELNYPQNKIEILIISDGSEDATETIVHAYSDKRVRLIRQKEHRGKIEALNLGVTQCNGELIIFTDADAILSTNTLSLIVPRFSDAEIGGICGQRIIAESWEQEQLHEGQADYIRFDSLIKEWENNLGSLTSNDGKLYVIRKKLFLPIIPAVTDDLFVCLGVISQGKRFQFEPMAHAFIPVPSRSIVHEVERRRRITSQSLNGIRHYSNLFNIKKFGIFSIRLFINKVLRRMIPFSLLMLIIGTLIIATDNISLKILVKIGGSGLFFLVGGLFWSKYSGPGHHFLKKMRSASCYFFLGNYGTLLGVIDFIQGKQPTKWIPKKNRW